MMRIATRGVRLPDFDERIRDRPRVGIEHAPGHDDALADRIAIALLREIEVVRFDHVEPEHRARNLGERRRQDDERLRR